MSPCHEHWTYQYLKLVHWMIPPSAWAEKAVPEDNMRSLAGMSAPVGQTMLNRSWGIRSMPVGHLPGRSEVASGAKACDSRLLGSTQLGKDIFSFRPSLHRFAGYPCQQSDET